MNLSLLICQCLDINAWAAESTPLFYGSVITHLFHTYGVFPEDEMTIRTPPLPADITYCRTLRLIAGLTDGRDRFMDSHGNI
jgi:hypothetical protein